jgi:hypothetical protein
METGMAVAWVRSGGRFYLDPESELLKWRMTRLVTIARSR